MRLAIPTAIHRRLVERISFRRLGRYAGQDNGIPRERRESCRPDHLAIPACQGRWREMKDFTFRYRID